MTLICGKIFGKKIIDKLFHFECRQNAKQNSKHKPRLAVSGYIEVLVLISIVIITTSILYAWFDSHQTQLLSNIQCTVNIKSHLVYKDTYWTHIEIKNTGYTIIDYYDIMHVNGSSIMQTSKTSTLFELSSGVGSKIEPQQNTIITPKNTLPATITISPKSIILVQAIKDTQSTFCEAV